MTSKRVEFKTMTNLDDSEQSTQKDDEQNMENEIRSAGNGAFDRSDILYLMDSQNELQSVEGRKRQQLEEEVANFRVNALNKKPTTVIAMKEKRHIAPPPAVMIKKKKKQKVSSNNSNSSSSSDAEKSNSNATKKEGSILNTTGTCSQTHSNDSKSKNSSNNNNIEEGPTVAPGGRGGALGGLLGDYSDSD